MAVAPASAANYEEITRGEFVKAIIEGLGVPVGSGKSVKFKDVPDSLKPYIEKAVELKLIKGKTATEFAPDEKLTRTHASIIAARGIQDGKTYSEDVLNKFKDANKVGADVRQEVAKAVELGLLTGFEDSTIRPNNIITKEELQEILHSFLNEHRPILYSKFKNSNLLIL